MAEEDIFKKPRKEIEDLREEVREGARGIEEALRNLQERQQPPREPEGTAREVPTTELLPQPSQPAPAGRRFTLRIESAPTGADFELHDNRRVIARNKTPFEINLPEGTYVIEISGYVHERREARPFAHWENFTVSRRREIPLNRNVTIRAIYTILLRGYKYEAEEHAKTRAEGLGTPPTAQAPAPPVSPESRREEREPWKPLKFKVIEKEIGDEKKQLMGKIGNERPIKDAVVTVSSPHIGGTAGTFKAIGYTDGAGIATVKVPPLDVPFFVQSSKEFYKSPREREIDVTSKQDFTDDPIILEPEPFATLKREKKRKEEEEKLKEEEKALKLPLKKPSEKKQEREGKIGEEKIKYLGFTKIGIIGGVIVWLILTILYEIFIGKILGIVGLEANALFRILGPVLIAIFVIFGVRGGGGRYGGIWKVVKPLLPFLLVFILIYFVIGVKSFSNLTDFDWYVNRLDLLRYIGVPQDTIDNAKDGIRNVLSFLHFKAVEPTKPEAKKIGGFEAIQLKFGSRYNDFLLPTLFARMDYTLPVTVVNPNKLDTKLVVKDFTIDEAYINKGTGINRVLCGGNVNNACAKDKEFKILNNNPSCCKDGVCKPVKKYSVSLGDIQPDEEKDLTVDFKGLSLNDLESGNSVDCRFVANKSEPMTTVKFRQQAKNVTDICRGADDALPDFLGSDEALKRTRCGAGVCVMECSETLARSNNLYGLPESHKWVYNVDKKMLELDPESVENPDGNEIDTKTTRYIESEAQCECKVKKYYNIMDDLCFLDKNKAKIEVRTSFNFNVQGKGELILIKTESDKKLSPRQTITSSAGPLTVTTYFVSDTHVFLPENAPKTTKMFIEIKNDGSGNGKINKVELNGQDLEKTPIEIENGITINKCVPKPSLLTIGTEATTLVCDVSVPDDSKFVTGAYLTVPVIVDANYSYSEIHSTTINVKEETIPEGVDSIRAKELNIQFYSLPYYCPTRKVSDRETGFSIGPLTIYNPETCEKLSEAECNSKIRPDCVWFPPADNELTGKCTTI